MKSENQDLFEGGRKLPLVEAFYTIQGEGYHTGKAAYFIRIGGCDIGCHWCDTKFSWNPDIHPVTDTDQIVSHAAEYPAKAVVVTGGEPLTYNLDYLCEKLKQHGIQTYLETSGSYALTGDWDWICLSPKKNAPPVNAIYSMANELKVIVFNPSDFQWAEFNAKKVRSGCQLYLQPEWSRVSQMLPEIIQYCKENPQWQVSLQSHKYMNIP